MGLFRLPGEYESYEWFPSDAESWESEGLTFPYFSDITYVVERFPANSAREKTEGEPQSGPSTRTARKTKTKPQKAAQTTSKGSPNKSQPAAKPSSRRRRRKAGR